MVVVVVAILSKETVCRSQTRERELRQWAHGTTMHQQCFIGTNRERLSFLANGALRLVRAKAKSLPVFFGGHSSENNLERRVITRLAHICIGLCVGTLSLKTSTLSGVAHRIFFFP